MPPCAITGWHCCSGCRTAWAAWRRSSTSRRNRTMDARLRGHDMRGAVILAPMPPVPRPAFARLALAASFACVVLPAWAAKVADVQVHGLDPAMTENVRRSLSLVDAIGKDVSGRRLSYLVREAEAETREALEPFGYYSPVIDVQRTREEGDAPVTVTVTVQPGTPVRVRNSDVGIAGEGAGDRYLNEEIAAFKPKRGDLFEHVVYEDSKA